MYLYACFLKGGRFFIDKSKQKYVPTKREEMAHTLRLKKFMVKVLLHENFMLEGNIGGGSGGQSDKKKKPLIYQGFSVMEHSGIEPLTSTLPA